MKVFISWSGEMSKNLASALREWLPAVIQAVKPYFSPDDIAKGSRWGSEISKELEASSVGIICLTKDNLTAPWIMFEAGALAKKLDKSKLCPILFGINPTDVTDPLAQFQASRFEKSDIKKVVKMINSEIGDFSLTPEVFDSVFEMWWPRLEEKVNAILENVSEPSHQALRSERELLEEILSLTRSSSRSPRTFSIPPRAIDDLITSFNSIVHNICNIEAVELFSEDLKLLKKVSNYLLKRHGATNKDLFDSFQETCDYLDQYIGSQKPEESEN